MAVVPAIRVTVLMKKAAGRALKTFVQQSFRELIEATPVRTGWAQSNWLAGSRNLRKNPVGSKKSIDYGPQQESFRTIRQWNPSKGKLSIYNNVPYIELLNQGRSPQAPAGFVDSILEKVLKETSRGII